MIPNPKRVLEGKKHKDCKDDKLLGHASRSWIIYGSYIKKVKSQVESIEFDLFWGLYIVLKVSVCIHFPH